MRRRHDPGSRRWIRRGYELDILFLGRPVRPFHLAVTIATGVVGYTNTFDPTSAMIGPQGVGFYLGVVALLCSTLLCVGWWGRNDWCAEWGLLLAAGVWMTRMAYIALTEGSSIYGTEVAAILLSLAWAVGAGGAYMLERIDHATRGASE